MKDVPSARVWRVWRGVERISKPKPFVSLVKFITNALYGYSRKNSSQPGPTRYDWGTRNLNLGCQNPARPTSKHISIKTLGFNLQISLSCLLQIQSTEDLNHLIGISPFLGGENDITSQQRYFSNF